MAQKHEGLYTQADTARAVATAGAVTRTVAKSTGFAILADRPRHIEREGINGFEQVLATVLVLIMLVITGVTWALAPVVGAVLATLGTYFVARRAAAFGNAPLRVRTFMGLVGTLPLWWTLSSLGVVAAATLHRSVVLEWIPAFVRDATSNIASIAIILNFAVAVWLGTRAIKQHREAAAIQAQTEASLAHMLGGTPRALFEPSPQTGMVAASWGRSGAHILVSPQANVDLTSISDRLAGTGLGQHYEVAEADWERILLSPISEETLDRQRQRAASGGLIEGERNIAPDAEAVGEPIALDLDLDADDPFAHVETEGFTTPMLDDGNTTPSFGEETWR